MTSIRSSDATTPVPGAAQTLLTPDSGLPAPVLSKKERKRLRRALCRAEAAQGGHGGRVAITKKERKRSKRRGGVAITERERERLAAVHQRAAERSAADEAWRAKRIAELIEKQNAAWQKQVVVPSKSMQLRLDRAARDMRQRVERGEGGFEARVLDVRFWDYRTAFEGVDPDYVLPPRDRGHAFFGRPDMQCETVYDWWLTLDAHFRNMLLEMIRLEVGETSVSFRPKRKCPYCGRIARVRCR